MVVFNTDGIAGGSTGTWRGAYEYQVPASGDGASLGLWNILFAFVDTYYLVQVHRMAYTRSGMTSASYREYRAPLSAVVALVAMYVYGSSATGRFPRALLYEEVFYTLQGVSAS